MRHGIRVGPPPGGVGNRATGYVRELQENLFEPLSERVKRQFVAGAGGELNEPDGQSGNMYAVYSSSALCVNLFHRFARLLDEVPRSSKPLIDPLLKACGLPANPARTIDFEVRKIVNPAFFRPPHLDVQIWFDDSRWNTAGIEAKFCEPYGGRKPNGLKPCYLRETAPWRDWPNIRALAQELSPEDRIFGHLQAAQLLIHLLGLRNQNGMGFILVYLWFDVLGAEEARRHRREIDSFGEILQRDGVPFVSRTYQEVFESLSANGGGPVAPHATYLFERYLDDAPGGDNRSKA